MKWQVVQCIGTLILSVVLIVIFAKDDISFTGKVVAGIFIFLIFMIIFITYCVESNNSSLEGKHQQKIKDLEEKHAHDMEKYSEEARKKKEDDEITELRNKLNEAEGKLRVRDCQLKMFHHYMVGLWADKNEKCPEEINNFDELVKGFEKFNDDIKEYMKNCNGDTSGTDTGN